MTPPFFNAALDKTSGSLYAPAALLARKEPPFHTNMSPDGPQNRSGRFVKEIRP